MLEATKLIDIVEKTANHTILKALRGDIDKYLEITGECNKEKDPIEINSYKEAIFNECAAILMKESIRLRGILYTRDQAADGLITLPYHES